MLIAWYKFAILSDEVRATNKIKSKSRLDCILFTDKTKEGYKGLTNFVNAKGQLFFYKTPCRDFVNTDTKRIAEWGLTNNSLNFSSIYIEDLDCPEIGYGYPNPNRFLGKNKTINPLFPFRNDCYLFIVNADYSEIEILVIEDGRNLVHSYYQKMIDGGFDDEIKQLKVVSKPFFKYDGFVL